MAGDAVLVRLDQERVAIAVGVDPVHVLGVAGRLALAPERAARPRPVVAEPGLERLRERLAVHPRDHEHLAGLGLLDHGGDEPVGVPLELARDAHASILTVHAALAQVGLGLGDRVAAEVEHGGDQQGIGLAVDDALAQVLERARRRPRR